MTNQPKPNPEIPDCSRIVSLHAENVMRLRAVDLAPPANLVQVVGANEQGKSSLLKSIEIALAGADAFPEMPVRKGQKGAVVDLDLGELTVHRTISQAGATSLTVKAKDGTVLNTPQKILDALRGNRTFDPVEFMRLKPDKRAEMLRQIAGLDTAAIDQQRVKLADERTVANRELKALEARLAAIPKPADGLPVEETSATSILAAQTEATATNANNASQRREAANARLEVNRMKGEIEIIRNRMAQIQQELEDAQDRAVKASARADQMDKQVAGLKDVNVSGFAEQLKTLEQINIKVRQARLRKEVDASRAKSQERATALDRKISALDTQRADLIQGAKYPIPGLGFTDSGEVAFNVLPFAQASTAQQLKVSVAIGLALNPKLRILLIRNGNDLDAANMEVLAGMAREHNAQIWIERVVASGEVAVVIEDGQAVNRRQP